jgi:hypothetical protein
MKKIIIIAFAFVSAVSLTACSTPKVEKSPVVIEDTNEETLEDVSTDEAPETVQNDAEETSDTTKTDHQTENTDAAKGTASSGEVEESGQPFEAVIELEGTPETVMYQTFQISLGYTIDYDIDRFKVTSENGADSFMAENPDPELYPYVYLNISRVNYPVENSDKDLSPVKDSEGNILGYLDSDITEPLDPVEIGGQIAYHFIEQDGKEWNSPVRNYYFMKTGNYVYVFEIQYFLEASEGFGARIDAMLDTFTLK